MCCKTINTSNTFTDEAEAWLVIWKLFALIGSRALWSSSGGEAGHEGKALQGLVRYGERGSTGIIIADKPLPGAWGDHELNNGMSAF